MAEILYTQKVFNGSDYDTLYPETIVEQVQGAIATTEKGAANGVATLGSDTKVPEEQLPEISVEKVRGAIVDPTTKSAGQLLGYNGNVWAAVDTPAGLKGASGTLTVAGWVQQANNSFAQTVTIANVGLTSASNVIVDCALSMVDLDADVAVLEGWGNVNNAVAGTNQLTFYCYAIKPDVNIPVNVVVSG